MFKNFFKNAALSACLTSMLMIRNGWSMTTGKHIQIEWTEEDLCLSAYNQLSEDILNRETGTQTDVGAYIVWIDQLIESLKGENTSFIDKLKYSKLEQWKRGLNYKFEYPESVKKTKMKEYFNKRQKYTRN